MVITRCSSFNFSRFAEGRGDVATAPRHRLRARGVVPVGIGKPVGRPRPRCLQLSHRRHLQLPPRRLGSVVLATSNHPNKTFTRFSDFWTPSPLSVFGTYLRYRIHATSLTSSSFRVPLPPPSADIICGWSLSALQLAVDCR